MLATVENHCSLNAGITDNLELFLPNGPVLEGQMLLSSAKIHKAVAKHDIKLFVDALKEIISCIAFVKDAGNRSKPLDINNVTYGTFPLATKDQQKDLIRISEQYALLYFSMCILEDDIGSLEDAIGALANTDGFLLSAKLMELLKNRGTPEDYNHRFAQLVRIHASRLRESSIVSPKQVFEIAFKFVYISNSTGNHRLLAETLLSWLQKRWQFIWQRQRFLLTHPSLHEKEIERAIEQKGVSPQIKNIDILKAFIPMLEFSNKSEVKSELIELRKQQLKSMGLE